MKRFGRLKATSCMILFWIVDCRPTDFPRSRFAGFTWLDCHVVKSRIDARIRRNSSGTLCFHDPNQFIEIGFARQILADFAAPSHRILVRLHGGSIAHTIVFRSLEEPVHARQLIAPAK